MIDQYQETKRVVYLNDHFLGIYDMVVCDYEDETVYLFKDGILTKLPTIEIYKTIESIVYIKLGETL